MGEDRALELLRPHEASAGGAPLMDGMSRLRIRGIMVATVGSAFFARIEPV